MCLLPLPLFNGTAIPISFVLARERDGSGGGEGSFEGVACERSRFEVGCECCSGLVVETGSLWNSSWGIGCGLELEENGSSGASSSAPLAGGLAC